VDDGSTDDSTTIIKDLQKTNPLILKKHVINKGFAEALLTLISEAAELTAPGDLVVTMDADDTHNPSYILTALSKFPENDIVIFSRYLNESKQKGYPLHKKHLSKLLNIVLSLRFGIQTIKDYTSGFRIYKAEAIKWAVKTYGRELIVRKEFTAAAEILLKVSKTGGKICELPFIYRYDFKQGPSSLKFWMTLKEYMKLLLYP